MDTSKYGIGYYPAPGRYLGWAGKDHIEKAPRWCSVDLRDGNQSLVIPMSLEEKLEFYHMLLRVGFKEIEVGFPAASETEYEFLRTLIENHMIPGDVTVQVLIQCREHIIRKTFEACKGAPSAIIHFYNSVSVAQREQVFRKSKEEIKRIAVEGAKLVKKLAAEYEGNFRFEYSPESFTGTEPEYALEVCNAVLDVLEPSKTNNVIINLPVTVEMSLPHVYASQVEYISENLKYREFVTLSLHPHNDRGTGVADTELGLLAGADRGHPGCRLELWLRLLPGAPPSGHQDLRYRLRHRQILRPDLLLQRHQHWPAHSGVRSGGGGDSGGGSGGH